MKLTGLTPILNVSDVEQSLEWFAALGWKTLWTYSDDGLIAVGSDGVNDRAANFAAVGAGECEIFLCRDGQGARGGLTPRYPGDEGTGAVWMSWWLPEPSDVDAVHTLAIEKGVMVSWPPTDEPWGVRECRIVHPDGHTFRIGAPLPCVEEGQA